MQFLLQEIVGYEKPETWPRRSLPQGKQERLSTPKAETGECEDTESSDHLKQEVPPKKSDIEELRGSLQMARNEIEDRLKSLESELQKVKDKEQKLQSTISQHKTELEKHESELKETSHQLNQSHKKLVQEEEKRSNQYRHIQSTIKSDVETQVKTQVKTQMHELSPRMQKMVDTCVCELKKEIDGNMWKMKCEVLKEQEVCYFHFA